MTITNRSPITWEIPHRHCLLILGLLGGVACGKSTVAELFARRGAHPLAADAMAHQSLQDSQVQRAICVQWGDHLVSDGNIQRQALAQIVFPEIESSEDRKNLTFLENLIHPIVLRDMEEILMALGHKMEKCVVVLDAALLCERGLDALCDFLIFIDTPLEIRQQRAHETRGWSGQQLRQRERWQMDLLSKRAKAHFILSNHGPQEELIQQIASLWQKIVEPFYARANPIENHLFQ